MASATLTMVEIYQRPEIPADVAEACDRLGWLLIRAQRFAGRTSYLVQDDAGIIEPYPARTILQTAEALNDASTPETAALLQTA